MRMENHLRKPRVSQSRRTGAMVIFIGGLLVILLAMVVLSVDTAYMQLARTELRSATDAAAKAAAGELNRTNGDVEAARAEGIRIASLNTVSGRPLALRPGDFEFGQAVRQSNGSWAFVAGSQPFSSVRVTGEKSSTSPSGPVNLLFAGIFGSSTFAPTETAVASQFDQEICLAIDRSHSMCFDLSGVSWKYPYTTGTSRDHLIWRPHPSLSRWAALRSALDVYLNVVASAARPPRVSLVTWGSRIDRGSYETSLTGLTFPATSIDALLTDDMRQISLPIDRRGSTTMFGGTNMAAGIDAARGILNGPGVRPLAKKVIILMTDGEWNDGRNPLDSAREAAAEGISIHTIGFLSNDDRTLEQIAQLTGGRSLNASSRAELEAVFRDLALSLPVALTE